MNFKSTLMGGALSFAHLTGLAGGKKAAKGKAEDDNTDEPGAEDGDEDEDVQPKGKKAKARAEEGEDEDGKEGSRAEDGDDDEDDEPKGKKARKAEDDDDGMDADDEEDDQPKGKKAKASADFRKGAAAERKRCAAIFASPAAGRNIPMAAELAFNTDMSAQRAIAVLKTSGASAAHDRSRRNPDVGSDSDPEARAAAQSGKGWNAAFAKAGVAPKAQAGGWDQAMKSAGR